MNEINKATPRTITESYRQTIIALAENPEKLELAYRTALDAGESDAFKQAITRKND